MIHIFSTFVALGEEHQWSDQKNGKSKGSKWHTPHGATNGSLLWTGKRPRCQTALAFKTHGEIPWDSTRLGGFRSRICQLCCHLWSRFPAAVSISIWTSTYLCNLGNLGDLANPCQFMQILELFYTWTCKNKNACPSRSCSNFESHACAEPQPAGNTLENAGEITGIYRRGGAAKVRVHCSTLDVFSRIIWPQETCSCIIWLHECNGTICWSNYLVMEQARSSQCRDLSTSPLVPFRPVSLSETSQLIFLVFPQPLHPSASSGAYCFARIDTDTHRVLTQKHWSCQLKSMSAYWRTLVGTANCCRA